LEVLRHKRRTALCIYLSKHKRTARARHANDICLSRDGRHKKQTQVEHGACGSSKESMYHRGLMPKATLCEFLTSALTDSCQRSDLKFVVLASYALSLEVRLH